ncbi:putative integral membrane protein (TIGR00698 family) [Ciceribacter lividus]|uniref:Putative integral membrane protein (TIGR00698 family) n=1 Tax=Ciceribacter lividus TaxID=1197950 RepID=A0A6I7HRT0_9HYPH|nr:putative sulfate exporter family transporter [Ciceribacter lividus]RCW27393.1 putative integral membrane protein (TIGR00698 family) [Ciceribacter lividus]
MLPLSALPRLLPGIALSALVSGLAILLERVEVALSGGHWIESLVLAILLGTALRSSFRIPSAFDAGIAFSAKILLEVAVVLLGASVSIAEIGAAGVLLVAGIAAVVVLSLAVSYGIGRALGLTPKLATLVACGNSICGNSAIAAAAPVIGAEADDVAAAIAFTAVLGVAAVLLMPALHAAAHLSDLQFGIFAGLTVYAVPQVLAATASAGLISSHAGTVVKLIRVLMLGPVLLALGAVGNSSGGRASLRHVAPWFIAGFAAMMALRSAGAIPPVLLGPITTASGLLTTIAMAGLGLTVDVRSVTRSGGRVVLAAIASLLVLCALSLVLLTLLAIN